MPNSYHPFRKGPHQLSVITTDLTESESLIKYLAAAEQRARPGDFAGNAPCVCYKMPYVPPYETFRELRNLILRVREHTGLRADYRGIVAVDVSQWLGHEQEEYFTVLLKYLYDHRDRWQATLVLNRSTPDRTRRFLTGCARYITPRAFDLALFSSRDALCGILRSTFARLGKPIAPEALQLLCQALMDPALAEARSLTLIQRAAEEAFCFAGDGRTITEDTIHRYLADPCGSLTLLAGRPLFQERSTAHDQDCLQL